MTDAADPIGRDGDLEAIGRFVADPVSTAQVLVLGGDAGIGKTSIFNAALARIPDGRALVARPTDAERRLSLAGLTDLLERVDSRVFATLPAPQRQAIEVATLVRDPVDGRADARAVASGLRGVLDLLSRTSPLVIAIDDLPLLDDATAAALAFALRRSGDRPIRVVATVRGGDGAVAGSSILDALPRERITIRVVGGLSLGALGQVLRRRLDRPIPRHALLRLHEASLGNPLLAFEMARAAIARTGGLGALDPPVLDAPLDRLVTERIARLPQPTRDVLLLVAVDGHPTAAGLGTAAGIAASTLRLRLEPALEAGILTLGDDGVRFAHPLYAAAAYEDTSDSARRAAHRRMAATSGDAVERARHLALAQDRPDARVAGEIETGARLAASRGAMGIAAELMGHARRVSTGRDARSRRAVSEAELRWSVGDATTARVLLEQSLVELRPGRARDEAALLLGVVIEWLDGQPAATAWLRRALASSEIDPEVEAAIRLRLATADFRPSIEASEAEQATGVLETLPDDKALDLRACAASVLTEARLRQGLGVDEAAVTRAEAALRDHGDRPPTIAAFPAAAIARERLWIVAVMRDDLSVARRHLAAESERLDALGWDRSRSILLSDLSFVEAWMGDVHAAAEHAREALDLASLIDAGPYAEVQALEAAALASAIRGDFGAARASLARASSLRAAEDDPWLTARGDAVLGFIELCAGRLTEASRALGRVAETVRAFGVLEPSDIRYEADYLEVEIGLGRLGPAEAILADLENRRRAADRPWLGVVTARGRALLAAARGDPRAALDELAAGDASAAGLEMPLEIARSLLVAGRLHRRLREKRRAREVFEAAVAEFDRIGAERWAAIARDELARTGVRTVAPNELTETERRVAELAATGRTNREVAQAAFLSPKSVDGVLIRVYQKLGIHSRAELGAVIAAAAGDGSAVAISEGRARSPDQ